MKRNADQPHKKNGKFASKITKDAIVYLIEANKSHMLVEDIVSAISRMYGVDPRTAMNWFFRSQRIELKMNEGLSMDEAIRDTQ